jgi:hypothetical protein
MVFFYAPRVWYDEGAVVQRVQAALKSAGLPEVSEHRILNAASWARVIIPRVKRYTPDLIQEDGVYSADRLSSYLQGTEAVEDRRLSQSQRLVIARVLASYYLEVLTAAAQRWPWRWKLS